MWVRYHYRRFGCLMLALVASCELAIPAAIFMAIKPPEAKAQISLHLPCGIAPDGFAQDACNAINHPVSTGVNAGKGALGAVGIHPHIPNPTKVVDNAVKDVVGAAANAIVTPIISELTKLSAGAMTYVLKAEVKYINQSTAVQLTLPWFLKIYALLLAGALAIAIVHFAARITINAGKGDMAGVGRGTFSFAAFMYFGGILPFIVGGVVWFCDTKFAPFIMHMAFTDLGQNLTSTKLDFTKGLSITNNPVTPILIPALAAVFGTIGGFFTWIMFQVRQPVLLALVIYEAYAMGTAVANDFQGDTFIRSTMALIAWMFLKVAMAVLTLIGVYIIAAPDQSVVITGGIMLMALPVLGWMFIKRVAGHDVSVYNGVMGANTVWRALPKFA
jgi:hypothetical protein